MLPNEYFSFFVSIWNNGSKCQRGREQNYFKINSFFLSNNCFIKAYILVFSIRLSLDCNNVLVASKFRQFAFVFADNYGY